MPKEPAVSRRRNRHAGGGGTSVADIMARNAVTPTTAKRPVTQAERRANKLSYVNVEGMPKAVFSEQVHGKTLKSVPRTSRTQWEKIAVDANGESRYNCIRVANTVELRRRGYDVQAGQTSFRPDPKANRSIVVKTAERHNDLVASKTKQKMTTSDIAIDAWKTKDGQNRIYTQADKAISGVKGGVNGATVKMFEKEMPDGASGFATAQWKKTNSGHIWNWVKEDGKIKFFEAQTHDGFVDTSKYISMASNGSLKMVRIDDMVPTDDILKVIDIENA